MMQKCVTVYTEEMPPRIKELQKIVYDTIHKEFATGSYKKLAPEEYPENYKEMEKEYSKWCRSHLDLGKCE